MKQRMSSCIYSETPLYQTHYMIYGPKSMYSYIYNPYKVALCLTMIVFGLDGSSL